MVHPDQTDRQRGGDMPGAPEVFDVKHFKLHYDRHAFCGHPRQGVFRYYGGGEIVIGHNHAPCDYKAPSDVGHDLGGYHSRSVALLQRSTDGALTWPERDDVVVYDETIPADRKRAFLFQGDAPRERCDMFSPQSLFYFGRTYLPDEFGRVPVCFALRSPDKGRTWEGVPTLVRNRRGECSGVHKDCHPVVRMPDGKTLLAGMTVGETNGPAVYASRDNGLTWDYLAAVATEESGEGRFTYVGLLLMPGGELQCYYLHIHRDDGGVEGVRNAICMSVSRDGGRSWTDPAPIVGKGGACWKNPGTSGNVYRSPWPMLLCDGRILVVFARRRMPMGIGGVLSEDGGRRWGEEFVIRDDASMWDLGYPVGCQMEDGRVFIAYYYNEGAAGPVGAVRHIAGSTFGIEWL